MYWIVNNTRCEPNNCIQIYNMLFAIYLVYNVYKGSPKNIANHIQLEAIAIAKTKKIKMKKKLQKFGIQYLNDTTYIEHPTICLLCSMFTIPSKINALHTRHSTLDILLPPLIPSLSLSFPISNWKIATTPTVIMYLKPNSHTSNVVHCQMCNARCLSTFP